MIRDDRPKSAYEIAMEKLRRQDRERGQAGPAALTNEQKEEIAGIRRRHEARLAEREILHQADRSRHLDKPEELEKVEEGYLRDRARIEEQREREIAAVHARAGSGSGRPGPEEHGGAGPTSQPEGSPPVRPRGRRPRGSPSG